MPSGRCRPAELVVPAACGSEVTVRRWLLLAAVLLVALNLRGPIAAVSPVLSDVKAGLDLSAGTAGLLTSLPVLCFAAASGLIGRLAGWTGVDLAILLGLAGIVAGTVLRSVGGLPGALAGTLAIGVAITIGNVLVPVVIKQNFAGSAGTVTGAYAAALTGGAALTAAVTAPLSSQLGWRGGLAAWSLVAVAAAVAWWAVAWWYVAPGAPRVEASAPPAHAAGVLRHPVAWAVSGFLGAQSAAYYAITAWLPTQLTDDAGLDADAAGAGMSMFQLVGIAGTLVVPVLVGRSRRQDWLGALVAGGWALMLLGLLVAPSAWLVWTAVGGLAQGAGISLAFTLIVLRAGDAHVARQLSAMAQAIGYSIGAAGPFLVGLAFQHSGGWTWPLTLLVAVSGLMLVAAAVAGRDVRIGEPAAARGRA